MIDQLSTPDDLDLQRLHEQYAERHTLAVLSHGITFLQCLKQQDRPTIEVVTAKGDTITLRGSDLYDQRTWKQFLASLPHAVDLCTLMGTADALTKRYTAWLHTAHTGRYQALTAVEQLAWLECIASLAVIWHMMEQKVEDILLHQRTTFADPWVEAQMCSFLEHKGMIQDAASLIHRLVTEAERAEDLINQLADELERGLLARPTVPHTALPPLPDGAAMLPALLFIQERRERYE